MPHRITRVRYAGPFELSVPLCAAFASLVSLVGPGDSRALDEAMPVWFRTGYYCGAAAMALVVLVGAYVAAPGQPARTVLFGQAVERAGLLGLALLYAAYISAAVQSSGWSATFALGFVVGSTVGAVWRVVQITVDGRRARGLPAWPWSRAVAVQEVP